MGKNFCKVEGKWCKFCQAHGHTCRFNSEVELKQIHRCPKREATRTVRFKDYIKDADFDSVMEAMCKWWPNQNQNRIGYADVWDTLQNMKAIKTDWFVHVTQIHEDARDTQFGHIDEENWLCVDGIDNTGKVWSIEFEPWNHWLGMNINKETLDTLSKEEIIAAILYEMTFDGYSEEAVQSRWHEIHDSFNDFINSENKK